MRKRYSPNKAEETTRSNYQNGKVCVVCLVESQAGQGAEMSRAETGTVTWYGIKEDDGAYAVFDTFDDEAGRDAHLNGDIAKALMAKADELFSNKLQIHKIQIIADK
jgi:quinol monooxygenase YgiN